MSTDGPQPEGPRRPDWSSIHVWQIQFVRDLLVIAGVVGLVYLGYVLRLVTVPLLLALLLAYLFEPLVRRLTRPRRVNRPVAALGILTGAVFFVLVPLAGVVGFGVVQGADAVGSVTRNLGHLAESVRRPDDEAARDRVPEGGWRELRDLLVRVDVPEALPDPDEREDEHEDNNGQQGEGEPLRDENAGGRAPPNRDDADEAGNAEAPERAEEDVVLPEFGANGEDQTYTQMAVAWLADFARANAEAISRQAITTGTTAIQVGLGVLRSIGLFLFTLFLTAFFFFFLCSGYERTLSFLRECIPAKDRERTLDLIGKMDRVIAGFVRGRLIIAMILMTIATVGYWLIGVPAPLILGPIVGALSVIPYVSIVGLPVSILLLWLEPTGPEWQSNWWWVLGAPTALYVLIQTSEDYVWNPLIQGKTTNMDTPTILFAVLAGGVLAGFYGVLLAIPVAACLKIVLREVFWPRFKGWIEGRERDFLPIDRD